MSIVLASSSPRRKQLLSLLTSDFTVFSPEVDETPFDGESPSDYAKRISLLKARTARDACGASGFHDLLIACDTIVTVDNVIIGKPSDYSHALEILTALQGRSHHVVSALALIDGPLALCETESTEVRFKKLGRGTIISYLNGIEYADKAGAYAIQENGSLIVESIRGSLSNVIGFPVRLLLRMMSEHEMLNRLGCGQHARAAGEGGGFP